MAPIELIKDTIPDIRFLHDLQDVVYDQEWFKNIADNLKIELPELK